MRSVEISKENISNFIIGRYDRMGGRFSNLCRFYQITNDLFMDILKN